MSVASKREGHLADPGLERLLAAARDGDGRAFEALVAPHLRALHVHCYRMLGSYVDAEEAVQEATVRAWRGLGGYRATGPLRHWLYRIATTTCLKMINRRGRDPLANTAEVAWLEPYPDALLDQLADNDDPAAVVERRESVALAFVAALQLLPATQRAVLILREVLDLSAREVADLLDTSVAGVNSALQRARATVGAAPATGRAPTGLTRHETEVLDRFLRAWHARDIPALAALLREDVTLTMPPQSIHIAGRDAVVDFFATVPAAGRLDRIRLIHTRANGHPALAAYLPDDHDRWRCRGYGIMVLTVVGDQVATITGFTDPALFRLFELPETAP